MAYIDPNLLKDWQDGEIVYADDYKREREILYTGSNDNYARLIKQFIVLDENDTVIETKDLDTVFNYLKVKPSDTGLVVGIEDDVMVFGIGVIDLSHINMEEFDERYALNSAMIAALANKTDKTGAHQGTWFEVTINQLRNFMAKVSTIQEGAEKNQNAFSKVNNIEANQTSDSLEIEGSVGIVVSTDPISKRITITATGEAAPANHGATHMPGGSDPIPGLPRFIVSTTDIPAEPNTLWFKDIGDTPDIGDGGLIIANASTDGTEPILFDIIP